jgi:hypothetical protein
MVVVEPFIYILKIKINLSSHLKNENNQAKLSILKKRKVDKKIDDLLAV